MGLLLALRSGVPLLRHAGAQPEKSRTLQSIERHVRSTDLDPCRNDDGQLVEKEDGKEPVAMGWGSFLDPIYSTRQPSGKLQCPSIQEALGATRGKR
jgi:hypothetical protein